MVLDSASLGGMSAADRYACQSQLRSKMYVEHAIGDEGGNRSIALPRSEDGDVASTLDIQVAGQSFVFISAGNRQFIDARRKDDDARAVAWLARRKADRRLSRPSCVSASSCDSTKITF